MPEQVRLNPYCRLHLSCPRTKVNGLVLLHRAKNKGQRPRALPSAQEQMSAASCSSFTSLVCSFTGMEAVGPTFPSPPDPPALDRQNSHQKCHRLGRSNQSLPSTAELSRVLLDLVANLRGRTSNPRRRSQPGVGRVSLYSCACGELAAAESPVPLGTAVPLPRSKSILDNIIVSVVQMLQSQVEGLFTARPALP